MLFPRYAPGCISSNCRLSGDRERFDRKRLWIQCSESTRRSRSEETSRLVWNTKFITVLTTAYVRTLPWPGWLQSTSTCLVLYSWALQVVPVLRFPEHVLYVISLCLTHATCHTNCRRSGFLSLIIRYTNYEAPFFDVLLTVHLSIFFSVFNQLDAQTFVLQ